MRGTRGPRATRHVPPRGRRTHLARRAHGAHRRLRHHTTTATASTDHPTPATHEARPVLTGGPDQSSATTKGHTHPGGLTAAPQSNGARARHLPNPATRSTPTVASHTPANPHWASRHPDTSSPVRGQRRSVSERDRQADGPERSLSGLSAWPLPCASGPGTADGDCRTHRGDRRGRSRRRLQRLPDRS